MNFKSLNVFCFGLNHRYIIHFQNSVRGGGFVILGERVLSTPVGQKRPLAYSELMENTLAFEFAASAVTNS